MGVLKIVKKKKTVEAKPSKKGRGTQTTLREVWGQYRRGQRNTRIWRAVTVISVLLTIGFLAYDQFAGLNNRDKKRLSVLFELKAIDPEGHPVAAAKVTYLDKVIGVTDSFGEWRRFFKIRKGQSVTLKLNKRSRDVQLHATKNLLVPVETANIEPMSVKATVRLNVQRSKQIRSKNAPTEMPVNRGDNMLTEGAFEYTDENDPYYSVWFSVFDFGYDRAGKTIILKNKLIPALRAESAKLGLELKENSPWQVGIGHISYQGKPSFPGVIRVIARRVGSEKKIDFLKNYTGNSQITAEKILESLKLHTPKPYSLIKNGSKWFVQDLKTPIWKIDANTALTGAMGSPIRILAKAPRKRGLYLVDTMGKEPCKNNKSHCMVEKTHLSMSPPSQGWQRFQISVYGINRKSAHIYVGGLKATFAGDNRWSFWARPGHNTYFSVLKDGAIIYRRLLPSVQALSLPVISIPSSPIVHK